MRKYTGWKGSLILVVFVALSGHLFASSRLVGLRPAEPGLWELFYTGSAGETYTLQETGSLTGIWQTVGLPFLCQPGTNTLLREQSAPVMFWRLITAGGTNRKLYVVNMEDATLTTVKTSDRSVTGSFGIGEIPAHAGYISGLNRAYVSDLGTNGVHVIDTSTDMLLTNIALPRVAGSLDVDPARGLIYALERIDDHQGGTNLLVISASSNALIANVTVGTDVADIRVDSDAGRIYITDFVEGLKVLDSDDNSVLATIPIPGCAHGLAVDSAGGLVYVTQVESNTVSMVDLTSETVVAIVPVGNEPEWVALDSTGTKAYVTNAGDGTVSVINTVTRSVAHTLTTGSGAFYVIVDHDSNLAYVSNAGTNTVSVIDTTTDTVIDTIIAGNGPVGLSLID